MSKAPVTPGETLSAPTERTRPATRTLSRKRPTRATTTRALKTPRPARDEMNEYWRGPCSSKRGRAPLYGRPDRRTVILVIQGLPISTVPVRGASATDRGAPCAATGGGPLTRAAVSPAAAAKNPVAVDLRITTSVTRRARMRFAKEFCK